MLQDIMDTFNLVYVNRSGYINIQVDFNLTYLDTVGLSGPLQLFLVFFGDEETGVHCLHTLEYHIHRLSPPD